MAGGPGGQLSCPPSPCFSRPEAGVLVSGALAAASLPPPSPLSPPGGDRSSPRVPSGASEAGRTPRGRQPGPGASLRGTTSMR